MLTHEDGSPTRAERRTSNVALAERPTQVERRSSKYAPRGRGGGRSGGGKGGRPRTRWQRMRKWVFIGLGAAVMGPIVAFVIGWFLIPVPTSDEAALAQVARFTFADGTTEIATLRPEGSGNERINRERITLDQVPLHVRQAVLSAEDRTFYSNPGFDFMGIGRAVFNQLTGGVGGGSTITQQYVKVSTGQDEISLWRKFREVVLAVKISREQTKDEILENYLNTIYLGRGAYGIQAASKAYFQKDVGQLSVSEGAMLAGIIQSPSNWDPAKNLERSQSRWNFVLDGMVEQGWLSSTDRAQQTFPTSWTPAAPENAGMPGDDRYHIYERAMAELASHNITEEEINTLGLTVTTTIDSNRQRQAVDAINKIMEGQPENLRESVVSIDPRTGAIVAYYGGSQGLALDYAGEAERQPGSSFKPFVLAAALQAGKGVGLGSVYDGRSGQVFVPGGAPVDNSEGVNCDRCDVKYAMTKSINTVFYKMALDTGTQRVIDAAHAAGIPANLLPEARGGIALGDQEVHPVDMASAFATFAADGVYRAPYIVSKVTTADGRVLFEHEANAGEQRFPQQVARNVTESMLDVVKSSNIALDGGRPVAAKTGTVQQSDTGRDNKDAWTVGYTPSLSTAVWIGTDTSEPIRDSRNRPIYGRMLPGQIWQEFMNTALDGTPEEEFSDFVPMGTPPSGYGSGEQERSLAPTETPDAGDEDDENNGRGRNNDGDDSDDSDSGDSSDNGNSDSDDGGLLGGPGRGNGNGNDSSDSDSSDSDSGDSSDQSTTSSQEGTDVPASTGSTGSSPDSSSTG